MAGVETVDQHPRMPRELLKAAIEGDAQVLTKMLGLEEDGGHTSVTIELAAYAEIDRNLKSATFMGNTILHVLCANDHGELASEVCKKDGSLLRARNKMLETPLHCAAKGIVNEKAISALIEFARSEGELILKEVLRDRNICGETALHELVRYNYAYHLSHRGKAILNKMMECDPECAYHVDKNGVSSLDLVIAKGNDDLTEFVMAKLSVQRDISRTYCSPVNQPTASYTPKSPEIAMEIPASVSIFGTSPIHSAASFGNVCAARLLLEKDESLFYVQDSDGSFPLHVAAHKGHIEMVVFFIEKYFDFWELVDHRGRNFLHLAVEGNKTSLFLNLYVVGQHYKAFSPSTRIILDKLINVVDYEGNTPLHIASEKGYKTLMTNIWAIFVLSGQGILNTKGVLPFDGQGIRNKKGLSPFEVSVIDVKKRLNNSPERDDLVEQYIREHSFEFSPVWFNKVMEIAEGNRSSMTDQLQIIGLGAVLITTVAFAAAFTFPGGYNTNGSPLLAGKYLFKAFMLAITSAFLQSFFCVLMLMIGGVSSIKRQDKGIFLKIAMYLFSGAARSMVLSFGLGLYLVLGPANKGIGIFILLLTIFSVMLDITPQVSDFIIAILNLFGNLKEAPRITIKQLVKLVGGFVARTVTFLVVLRFALPFVFIFIFAFLP